MSTLEVNTINPQSGSTITLGSSGNTVALGSGVSGSGFGKIGQVVNTVYYTQTSTSSTSYTDISAGGNSLSASITPSSSSSKILVIVHINGAFINTASNERILTRLLVTPSGSGSSVISVYNGYGLGSQGNKGGATISNSTLYSVSSTVTHTFSTQFRSYFGNSVIVCTNDSGSQQLAETSSNSTMTLMEVLA